MNETPLYRQTVSPGHRRSALALGAVILLLVAAASLYISQAGEKEEANPEIAKTTESKSMSDTELHSKLSPEQYHVTRENGTEPPFHNAYWDNHKEGIYVDLISGEALFSSTDKFESGTC